MYSNSILVVSICNLLILTYSFPDRESNTISQTIQHSPKGDPENTVKFTTGKVFLLGGATSDTCSSIYNALRDSTEKPNPKIAVVISAAPSLAAGLEVYYEPDETSKSYQQLFTDYSFQPSVVHLAQDNYKEGANASTALGAGNIAIIENADVIFFNGGDQSRHSRSWFNDDGSDSDILETLRRRVASGNVVIAGTSAGLAVQSNPTFGEGRSYGYYYFDGDLKHCRIGETLLDDRQGQDGFRAQENGGYMKGFEFVMNALVDSHFDARGRFARLVVAMKTTSKPFGIGVDENTALYINHDTATVFGQYGVWIVDTVEAAYPNITGQFEAVNVRINYLTQGDSYNVTSKLVTSAKNPVTNTSQEDAYNSEDIFATDEALKSIISLVTSRQSESIGYSYESQPKAKVTFRKTTNTKFYQYLGNLSYTIDNLRLDIGTS